MQGWSGGGYFGDLVYSGLPHRWNDSKAAEGIPEEKLLPAGLESLLDSPTTHQSSLGPLTKRHLGGVWVKVVTC